MDYVLPLYLLIQNMDRFAKIKTNSSAGVYRVLDKRVITQ